MLLSKCADVFGVLLLLSAAYLGPEVWLRFAEGTVGGLDMADFYRQGHNAVAIMDVDASQFASSTTSPEAAHPMQRP